MKSHIKALTFLIITLILILALGIIYKAASGEGRTLKKMVPLLL